MSEPVADSATRARVEILVKASAVLDVLAKLGSATVSEIADAVGEPVSSTYRMIGSLTDLKFVEPSATRGQHRLGIEIMRIGALVEGRLDLQRVARPILDQYHPRLPGTLSLFVRRGLRAVCIERVTSPAEGFFWLQVGDSLPLISGAPSQTLISFLPVQEREAILSDVVTSADLAASERARTRFREGTREVVDRGYAVDIGETIPGVGSFALPIHNREGETAAAICLSGLSVEVAQAPETSAELTSLRQAALEISEGLGAQPPGTQRDPTFLKGQSK